MAAELTTDSPGFGHLEPMVDAGARELSSVGGYLATRDLGRRSGLLAQASDGERCQSGYADTDPTGPRVTHKPTSRVDKDLYAFMRLVLSTELGQALHLRPMAMVEPPWVLPGCAPRVV